MSNPNPNRYDVSGADEISEPPGGIDFTRTVRKYGEVLEEINPRGEFVHMEDLLDKEIVVYKLEFITSKKGPGCFVIMVDENGEITHTYTGSKGIVPKLRVIAGSLPISCWFVEKEGGAHGRYWDVE
jgi:hypothetical protein